MLSAVVDQRAQAGPRRLHAQAEKAQESFLQDSSPQAYEKIVQRLLSHPGYGERWGRHWFDLVRYAETNGYERDATIADGRRTARESSR